MDSWEVFRKTVQVAAAASATLFTAGTDLDEADVIAIGSDEDVVTELTTDKDGDNGDELYTVTVKAGGWVVLGSTSSYANYTANFGGGTLDFIDRIRVKNNGSVTATVKLVAVT